ncbi:leucine carboxyl methyltransferase [Tenacibaculum skagerrakense]|uniref:Leucine carboxyl methyltransferase n=1 Tax=Tenacibaculum skagerrakense TaxID=186571 RepID=A0A4R2NKX8_9FLAO|nr:class I SAM-dependent methyltransferase [Tenacibaculum skagerrakense]TCP22187.1 leucine carboxyl methyltransferase [Tenacibaculum skagerrakense]
MKVHETAFMTSMFRAMDETLSKDVFSKLWNNQKTKVWVDAYLNEVSSEEAKTHCVRNRFFLERISQLYHEKQVDRVINFGSGFSMYPFLLNKSIQHIEIDKPEVIDYKKDKISDWISKGKLPLRDIHFIGADFSKDYEEYILSELKAFKSKRHTFILLEGVLFFLNKSQANRIFDFFNKIQKKGDFIGSVSFDDSIQKKKAFARLQNFFLSKNLTTTKGDYLTLNNDFYKNRTSYSVIENKDYFDYSKELDNTINTNATDILNENFYLLEKQN